MLNSLSTGEKRFKTTAVEAKPAGQTKKREEPLYAKLLLPVWGYGYVRQFLEIGLPTLLAPGNIPALAKALDCEFVILTSAEDESYIREHPSFARLKEACTASIQRIDHLITASNYSTTVTLAYTEGLRASGDAILDTCFFFLVSDYIMADGSLANVLDKVRNGDDAVVVGNFQVTAEDALPWLHKKLRKSRELALSSRELMSWALAHMHPATTANMVNFPFTHNSHTNRLFWRVDADTLIGRFYLMHMICIRPEVKDFTIGASCDYSFVPELCPSGHVSAITDSDDYLVVELQPRDHEFGFLRSGSLRPKELARSLSEWTTEQHRKNADHTIIYHASDLSDSLAPTIKSADAFVGNVRRLMASKSQPFRGHPYWRGAVAAFREATGKTLGKDEWRLVLGTPGLHGKFLDNIRFGFFGRPPNVKPWHPLWPDYRLPLKALSEFFSNPKKRLLIVSDVPTAFTVSLADNGERVVRKQLTPFLNSRPERFRAFHDSFDMCLLELAEQELSQASELLERVAQLVKPDGSILLAVKNQRLGDNAGEFVDGMAYHLQQFVRSTAWPTEVRFVPARFRISVQAGLIRFGKFAYKRPWIGMPALALLGPFLTVASLGSNILSSSSKKGMPNKGTFSSCLIRFGVNRSRRRLSFKSPRGSGNANGEYHETSDVTREPQYGRCVDLKNAIGLTPLGLMTNQVWHDDPRRLCFVLARYKFVAKMLGGRRNVGELGCGDAFGSRIVLQDVENLTVYDFDPTFIDDIRERMSEKWSFEARVHDIITGPLPEQHDGLYSLDVIEHIKAEDEHAYLANLRGSLTDDGVLIIGTPSLESQTYASPPSKAGHVNCKSGKQFKALMEQYFSSVFVFSMNDEVVHTGFFPMAHYLFAVCSGKPAHDDMSMRGRK